jgi:hypothetical protein
VKLVLHQRLSAVTGTCEVIGAATLTGQVGAELWGDRLRYACSTGNVLPISSFLRFDGHVHGNTMQGTLALYRDKHRQEFQWQAQRDRVDFTGTWEWLCLSGDRKVQLHIEHKDGNYAAMYFDQGEDIPVTDFYDLGGGLYFTLLIGRIGSSIRLTKDTGWLLGEGVMEDGLLKGKVEFHPYGDSPGMSIGREPPQAVIRDWTPRRIP